MEIQLERHDHGKQKWLAVFYVHLQNVEPKDKFMGATVKVKKTLAEIKTK